MSNSNSSTMVKIIHRLNKLKLKAGIPINDERLGYIDPKAIRKAQAVIDSEESHYQDEVETVLVKLDSTWEDLKKEKNQAKAAVTLNILYNYANNVKDMAETFHYDLMGYFGKSLRDFCEKYDASNQAHHVIVQAHIDVMHVAFQENIKEEDAPHAEELKRILVKAIEKHS